MTLEEVLAERLTEDKVAEALEANSEKLIAAGMAVDESNLRYIKLNKYERFRCEYEPEDESYAAGIGQAFSP
jgi:hypothetical protein